MQNSNQILGYGKNFNLLSSLSNFINATIEVISEKDSKSYDFNTYIDPLTINEYIQLHPTSHEFVSKTIEQFLIKIIVPKAGLINTNLYIWKPFTLNLWLLLMVYVIFGASILSLTFKIIQRKESF